MAGVVNVRVDPVIGRVHAVTATGDTLCGTVGKKIIGSLNRQSISCEKCQRIINKVGLKQDETGRYAVDEATRQTALYGEGSVKGKEPEKKSKSARPRSSKRK